MLKHRIYSLHINLHKHQLYPLFFLLAMNMNNTEGKSLMRGNVTTKVYTYVQHVVYSCCLRGLAHSWRPLCRYQHPQGKLHGSQVYSDHLQTGAGYLMTPSQACHCGTRLPEERKKYGCFYYTCNDHQCFFSWIIEA